MSLNGTSQDSSEKNSEHPIRALLMTVPLDVGISRSYGGLPVIPKIAIVSLIKWMEQCGYTASEYDYFDADTLDASDEEIINHLKTYQPTVVGLSAVVSTTYGQVVRLSKIIKEVCPNAWIVVGGSLPASARVVLKKTCVDICVQGDGEMPWVELLNYVKKYGHEWNYEELSKIKGLTYIKSNEMEFTGYAQKISKDLNPYPDFEILKMGVRLRPEAFRNFFRIGKESGWFRPDPRTFEPHRRPYVAGLWTTKGCVARCTFCQRSTKGYQVNSITTLDEHLKIMKEQYNVGFIQIIDENFGSDKKHAYEVAKTLKKYDMLWIVGGVRCTSTMEEDIAFYHEHGCSALKYGVESGSQKILDLMEKRFNKEDVFEAIKHCYSHGVYSPLAVMTGMPGETDETAMETGQFIGKIARMAGTPPEDMGTGIFYALPLPGTPLYEYAQMVGTIGETIDEEERYLLAVSDAGADKGNHVNINGASLRELLFWDFLIRYESTREYYSKPLGTDVVAKNLNLFQTQRTASEIHGVDHARMGIEKMVPTLGSMTAKSLQSTRYLFKVGMHLLLHPKQLVKTILFYCFSGVSLLNYKLVASPKVAKIPRPLVGILVYAPMRNLVYLEYLLTKYINRLRNFFGRGLHVRSLFLNLKTPPRLDYSIISSFDMKKDRSLRNVVRIMRSQKEVPNNLTDQNHLILVQGR